MKLFMVSKSAGSTMGVVAHRTMAGNHQDGHPSEPAERAASPRTSNSGRNEPSMIAKGWQRLPCPEVVPSSTDVGSVTVK